MMVTGHGQMERVPGAQSVRRSAIEWLSVLLATSAAARADFR
jgi:hypothetical protein